MDATLKTQASPTAARPSSDSRVEEAPLSADELRKMDAYWRASNYLSVGQIYLLDNPLLKEPLKREHIKPRLLGHWGTSPGLNMLCVHLNRVIKRDDLNMIYIIGPGHGGPSLVAHAYLEGTYSEVYPNISQDAEGMKRLFKQFSFPGGIPSHVAPETPGSIHEGGELGLRPEPRLRGRVRQPRPDRRLRRRRRRGRDRPARHRLARQQVPQPGPRRLRAADPPPERLQDRQPLLPRPHPRGRAAEVLRGHGLQAVLRRGARPGGGPPAAGRRARRGRRRRSSRSGPTPARKGVVKRPAWPMIVFRTPKGWTCPPEIDGKKCEGYWRSHQVPMGDMDKPEHIRILEAVDEELPAGGAVRRPGPAQARTGRAGPEGPPPHERQPARQRRPAAPRPEDAGLPRLRGRRAQPRARPPPSRPA